jgi:hypothetical protein
MTDIIEEIGLTQIMSIFSAFIMGRDHHGYFNNLDNEFLNKLKKLKIDFFIDMCLYSV